MSRMKLVLAGAVAAAAVAAGPVLTHGQLVARADAICLAWLLDRQLFERGWNEPFAGEIIGAIGSGIGQVSPRLCRLSPEHSVR